MRRRLDVDDRIGNLRILLDQAILDDVGELVRARQRHGRGQPDVEIHESVIRGPSDPDLVATEHFRDAHDDIAHDIPLFEHHPVGKDAGGLARDLIARERSNTAITSAADRIEHRVSEPDRPAQR